MQLFLNNLVNAEKNRPCLVMAHGPSLVSSLYFQEELFKLNPVLISCNYWYKFLPFDINYWIVANNELSVYEDHEIYSQFKNTKLLYAESVYSEDLRHKTPPLYIDYFRYDERNYNFETQTPNINRLLSWYTNYSEFYRSSATVALHMLAFAIILGCNPIYISGMDLDHKKGYAFNARQKRELNDTYLKELDEFRNDIIKSLITINSSAKNIGTRIYSFDKQPTFDLFDHISGLDLK
jgi:hypothetical protein